MQMIKSTTRVSQKLASRQASGSLVARAIEPPQSPAPVSESEGVIMTGGKTMSEQEYKKMEKEVPISGLWNPSSSANLPSFDTVMGFSGSPELINGRLAMMGFVAALGAELSSGDSVLRQIAEEPTGTAVLFILVIAGSLVPAFLNKKPETFAFFTPSAEMTNGRASMIGFAAMLLIESNIHHALF